MRVLAVTHEASRTGAVHAFLEALPVLRARADELVVVVKEPGPLVDRMRASATSVLVVPHPRTWAVRRLARLRPLRGLPPLVEGAVARRVLRAERPDLVYASTVLSSEYCTAAQRLGIPVLLHAHEQQPLSGWALRRARTEVEWLPAVAPSTAVADELQALGLDVRGVLRGPVRPVLREPPDVELPWDPGAFRVLACGSADSWKGVDAFLASAEQLAVVGGRPVQWVWVGGGSQLPALRQRTVERGLAGRVTWVGQVDDPRPWLRSADLLVLPSRLDSAPLVVLEAASVGTPTVGFAVGGVAEMLRDPRALAVPEDVDDLARRVAAALADEALRGALLDSSRPTLEASTLDRWQDGLQRVLDGLSLP